MRPISARFAKAVETGADWATEITCTVPGGEPVELVWNSGTVSSSNATGVRYQASLNLAPTPGVDTYGLVSTPGAIFHIRHGINFGGRDVELVEMGVYEAAKGAVSLGDGEVSLSLVDLWQRVERCRFVSPHYPENGTRASRIVDAIVEAIPTVTARVSSDGGQYVQGDNLWDRDRTKFINDMAADGSLDVYFDAEGAFVVRAEPIMDPTASVWNFTSGVAANILTADREYPFDRLYNTVIVVPVDATQVWARQRTSVPLGHPRYAGDDTHPGIGVVPFFYGAPTLTTEADAKAAGETILQRVLGTTETVSLNALSNPALEVGDVVTIVHEPTETDPGFSAMHLIDSWQVDLFSGLMTLATRSNNIADVEES